MLLRAIQIGDDVLLLRCLALPRTIDLLQGRTAFTLVFYMSNAQTILISITPSRALKLPNLYGVPEAQTAHHNTPHISHLPNMDPRERTKAALLGTRFLLSPS